MGLTERIASNERLGVIEGSFPLQHRYTAGVAGEKVLRELRDNGRLLGTRCGRCQVTYAPARLYCERCLTQLDEWVPIPLAGTLSSFTVVHQDVDGNRLAPPILLGLIDLDGATGSFVHLLGGVSPDQLRLGARVVARLKPAGERIGSIRDVAYFEPVD